MFRLMDLEKEFLCDAVFFAEHDSEQRHAADGNHRPRRRLRNDCRFQLIRGLTGPALSFGVYGFFEKQIFQLNRGLFI
jgi:hypothetical protein